MKYAIYALSLFLFISCSSDDDEPLKDYSAENEQEIIDFIAQYNLNATRKNSGLYYIVNEIGDGEEITATSDVSVRITVSTTDGNILYEGGEEVISVNLQDPQILRGWAEGFTYFNVGGSGTLILPAHLAYGSQELNGIPAGSVVIFDFEIVDYEVENDEEIMNYIAENEIANTIETGSGLYYVIEEEGTGEYPTESSNVTVAYTGYFTDGEIFDESSASGATFYLDQVISGWTEGIPYFKEGGKGKLIIPSHLGYGIYDYNGIPGGSILIFDIELKSIN